MFCCICAGACNHTGPHSYCYAHSGAQQVVKQPIIIVNPTINIQQ